MAEIAGVTSAVIVTVGNLKFLTLAAVLTSGSLPGVASQLSQPVLVAATTVAGEYFWSYWSNRLGVLRGIVLGS
jgi:hypothetical protein